MQEQDSGNGPELSSPFKPYTTILEEEVAQAQDELTRPSTGLFLSGLLAGFGVSISALLGAVVLSIHGDAPAGLGAELLMATIYATGFILVIMGRTDLFTEYTTMAILPVLVGRATLGALMRLWGLVYVANLAGAVVFALLAVALAPRLEVAEAWAFVRMADDLVAFPWWVITLSAILTGWMMGLLSWLLSAARDTMSQVLFVWVVAGAIGLLHLHHAITGTAEMIAGIFTASELTVGSLGYFLLWTTLGNIVGSVVFAVLIRYSVVIGHSRPHPDGGRKNSSGRRGAGEQTHQSRDDQPVQHPL